MLGMASNLFDCGSLVRLSGLGSMCSGVVVAEDMVLTAKHFLAGQVPRDVRVHGVEFSCGVAGWIDIAGTDVSVVRLRESVGGDVVTPVSSLVVRFRMRTFSFGHGNSTAPKVGLVVAKLPVAFSRSLGNRVRHAGLVKQRNPAVRGDSGGPVFVDGQLVGLQSMILDPFGHNVGLATVALLEPNGVAISGAMSRLRRLPS